MRAFIEINKAVGISVSEEKRSRAGSKPRGSIDVIKLTFENRAALDTLIAEAKAIREELGD